MQETGTETTKSNQQPANRSIFKRSWVWIILLCLVAGGAFAVWKTAASNVSFCRQVRQ